MSHSIDALEILELTLIPRSAPPIYAVGLAASRITFADQQRRAINVIWALLKEGRVRIGDEIVIVGGGIAGTTAAVYAAQQGLRVTVFEKYDDAFSIQQGSGRWIHPNIYDWPKVGWHSAQTSMPCMNWQAGTAGDVIGQLRTQWRHALTQSNLRWMPHTNVVAFSSAVGSEGFVQDSEGRSHGPFRCIVMAVGFGEEPARAEIEGRPYWRDDDLHQRIRYGGTALVSGCGDGGLIDAARIVLHDFRHDWLGNVASIAASDEQLIREIIRIEHDTPGYPDGYALTRATLSIPVADRVTSMIRERLRPNTKVILNGRSNGALTRGACMLNRFVIGQLINLGVVSYCEGDLDPSSVQSIGGKYRCTVNGTLLDVELVVVRHGPIVRPLAEFPVLDAELKPVRTFFVTYSAGVDRTRRRAWAPLLTSAPPTASTLPSLTSDVLDYLGQRGQQAIQQQLIRLNKLCTVAYHRLERGLEFRVRDAKQTHMAHLNISADAQLLCEGERASGEKRAFAINPGADVMTDAGAAAHSLEATIPSLVEWLMEESV